MKFSEVIKALEANPSKTFETTKYGRRNEVSVGSAHYFRFRVFEEDGTEIDNHIESGGFNDNVRIDADWQEIGQEVTWQEAIEAWANGKTISCTLNDKSFLYEGGALFLETGYEYLVDQIQPSKLQIKNGTWYIEADK